MRLIGDTRVIKSSWRSHLPAIALWAPAVLGLAYLAVFVAGAPTLTTALYRSADSASAPVIAELMAAAPDGTQIVLGHYAWYEPLWFLYLTRELPAQRELWLVAPFAFTALAVAVIAWSVWRVAGGWAAVIALTLTGALSTLLIGFLGVPNFHGHTFVHTALLGAAAVVLALRGHTWGLGRLGAFLGLVVVVSAPGAASDVLLVPWGLAPFAIAGVVLSLRGFPLRVGAGALAAAAATVAAGTALAAGARAEGVVPAHFEPGFASSAEQLWTNAQLLWQILMEFGHGAFFGRSIEAAAILALGCAVAVTALLVWLLGRARRVRLGADASPARAALVAFWSASLVLSAAAFVLASEPEDHIHGRYVLAAWAAVAVLAAAAARTRPERLALAAMTSLLAVTGIVHLQAGELEERVAAAAAPRPPDALALGRLADELRLDHGYAAYWTATPLTWLSRFEAKVYPVDQCGERLCPTGSGHRIDSWYRPRAPARTFIVVEPDALELGLPAPAAETYGNPEQVVRVGQLEVYVYGYDVASRFEGVEDLMIGG